jgi:hypothetical protein
VGERNKFDPTIFEEARLAVEKVGAKNVGHVRLEGPKDWGFGKDAETTATVAARYNDKEAGQEFIRALGVDYALSAARKHDCGSCDCRVTATPEWKIGRVTFYASDAVELKRSELLAHAAKRAMAADKTKKPSGVVQ